MYSYTVGCIHADYDIVLCTQTGQGGIWKSTSAVVVATHEE